MAHRALDALYGVHSLLLKQEARARRKRMKKKIGVDKLKRSC
jgi:hypothetical protein